MNRLVRSIVIALCVVSASWLSTPAQAEVNLFADSFDTSANSNAVDFEFESGRQSGVFAPAIYYELDATANGGPFDGHSQVGNLSHPNTLRMISDAPMGANTAVVSPNRNFLLPGFAVQRYHVDLNPAGPGSAASFDVWAGFNFGAQQGTVFFEPNGATGILVRPNGRYSVFDDGEEVVNGGVAPKGATEFYGIDFDVDFRTGAWSMAIDGTSIAAGNHGAYASAYLNLTYYSNITSTGQQVGHFDNLRVTGQTTGPTTLFADTFNVSASTNNINFEHDLGRQSGISAPLVYSENSSMSAGGAFDQHTQVNNPSHPNTLRMISDAPAGVNTAYASPNLNFLVSDFDIQHYHVELNPAGPGHAASSDTWAGFNFGAVQGTVFFEPDGATGILMRPNGRFSVFDDGVEVASGGVAPKGATEFYGIDVDIDFRSGAWSLAIDGEQIASAIHGDYSTNYLNLTYYSSSESTGQQIGHFDNFQVTGIVPELPALGGDYNNNGIVDAADYVVWRDTLGKVGPLLAADHTGPDAIPDGMVGQLDYELWRANFGRSLGAAAGGRLSAESVSIAPATVPEPATLVLMITATTGSYLFRARRAA